jgi:hypothetical protein
MPVVLHILNSSLVLFPSLKDAQKFKYAYLLKDISVNIHILYQVWWVPRNRHVFGFIWIMN